MPYRCVIDIITNRHPLGLKAFIQPITLHQTLLVHKQPIILTALKVLTHIKDGIQEKKALVSLIQAPEL